MACGREAAVHTAALAVGDPVPSLATMHSLLGHGGILLCTLFFLGCGWIWSTVHPPAHTALCLDPLTPPSMKPSASGTQKRCPPPERMLMQGMDAPGDCPHSSPCCEVLLGPGEGFP